MAEEITLPAGTGGEQGPGASTAGRGSGDVREAVVRVPRQDYATIGIAEVVERWRAADLQGAETIACRERGPVVEVTVGEPMGAAALRSLGPVETVERTAGERGNHGYVVAIEAPRFPTSLAEQADGLFGTCDCAVDAGGLTTSLVGSQPAIADAVAAYREAGMAPRLERLGSYSPRNRTLARLTERQREVLETAYRLGYFEVPREVTAEDVAAALDVGPSTVLEHLRRAERNLLGPTLETP